MYEPSHVLLPRRNRDMASTSQNCAYKGCCKILLCFQGATWLGCLSDTSWLPACSSLLLPSLMLCVLLSRQHKKLSFNGQWLIICKVWYMFFLCWGTWIVKCSDWFHMTIVSLGCSYPLYHLLWRWRHGLSKHYSMNLRDLNNGNGQDFVLS